MNSLTRLLFFFISYSFLSAEEFKHREIRLSSKGWRINMGIDGTLQIECGADMFDRGFVYPEIYSYEQFYKEVVEVMESGVGPNPEGKGAVGISVRPMDPTVLYEPHMPADPTHEARTDPLRVAISYSYDATDLWNGLLKKLLPAMEALKPDQVSDLLERESPFIKIAGGDDFKVPRLRPRMIGTREEQIARVMASLTPEQRVALGHPAEYPPTIILDGKPSNLKRIEKPGRDPTAVNSESEQSVGGKDGDKRANHGIPLMKWVITALLLILTVLAWIVGKRRLG